MSYEKKNWPLHTRVQFIKCCELTGKKGTVIGKSFVDNHDHYIVLLDTNMNLIDGYEVAACSITEHCLEEIQDLKITEVNLDFQILIN